MDNKLGNIVIIIVVDVVISLCLLNMGICVSWLVEGNFVDT